MADGRPGTGPEGTGDGEDPFARLLDPGFVADATVREPSAEERARAAERAARAAALQRRLADQEQRDRAEERRDRQVDRRRGRSGRLARVVGPVLVVALVVGAVWVQRGGSGLTAAPVRRPGSWPPVDRTASRQPLGTAPPAPRTGGEHRFVQRQPGDTRPVAWDPCRPVRYLVNPEGAPPGGDRLVQEAVARTAAATGLTFVDAGTTDEEWSEERDPYQPDRYGERWAPALIDWSDDTRVPALGGYVAGLGGGTAVAGPDGRRAYVSGQVVLDAKDLAKGLATPDGEAQVRGVIQHELGHLVGLDHVADPTELMFTEGSESQTHEWGPGDLTGLHALGSGDCFPEL